MKKSGGTAVKEPKPNAEVKTERVRSPKVAAGPCPRSANHKNTRIYKTDGKTRRAKCNDCGHTWKVIGPYADELRQYAVDLATALHDAGRADVDGEQVITMTDKLAKDIETKLRKLAAT